MSTSQRSFVENKQKSLSPGRQTLKLTRKTSAHCGSQQKYYQTSQEIYEDSDFDVRE